MLSTGKMLIVENLAGNYVESAIYGSRNTDMSDSDELRETNKKEIDGCICRQVQPPISFLSIARRCTYYFNSARV